MTPTTAKATPLFVPISTISPDKPPMMNKMPTMIVSMPRISPPPIDTSVHVIVAYIALGSNGALTGMARGSCLEPNGLEMSRPPPRARLPSLYASLAGKSSVHFAQLGGSAPPS